MLDKPHRRFSAKDIPYPATLVFNAGVCKWQGKYVMLFRNDYGFTEDSFRATVAAGSWPKISTLINQKNQATSSTK